MLNTCRDDDDSERKTDKVVDVPNVGKVTKFVFKCENLVAFIDHLVQPKQECEASLHLYLPVIDMFIFLIFCVTMAKCNHIVPKGRDHETEVRDKLELDDFPLCGFPELVENALNKDRGINLVGKSLQHLSEGNEILAVTEEETHVQSCDIHSACDSVFVLF